MIIDNGTEFTSQVVDRWACYIASFNGKFRDECLNETQTQRMSHYPWTKNGGQGSLHRSIVNELPILVLDVLAILITSYGVLYRGNPASLV